LKTVTELKEFTNNPHFQKKRQEYFSRLDISTIGLSSPFFVLKKDFCSLNFILKRI